MNYQIENTRSIHITEIQELQKVSGLQVWTTDTFNSMISSDNYLCQSVVSLVDNSLIGFAIFNLIPPESELLDIAINPKYRRQNIAKILILNICNFIKNKGVSSVFLDVSLANVAAQKLYLKLGFEQFSIRKKYYSDGSDALIFKLKLL